MQAPRRQDRLTDPLVCSRCGQRMQIIAFLTDQLSVRRILDHLGLGPPEQAPPPPVRETSASPSWGRVGGCRPSGSEVATATRRAPLPWMPSSRPGPRQSATPPSFGRPAPGLRGSSEAVSPERESRPGPCQPVPAAHVAVCRGPEIWRVLGEREDPPAGLPPDLPSPVARGGSRERGTGCAGGRSCGRTRCLGPALAIDSP